MKTKLWGAHEHIQAKDVKSCEYFIFHLMNAIVSDTLYNNNDKTILLGVK